MVAQAVAPQELVFRHRGLLWLNTKASENTPFSEAFVLSHSVTLRPKHCFCLRQQHICLIVNDLRN